MQSRNRFFEDTARLLQGFGDVAFACRDEVFRGLRKRRNSDNAGKSVSREEFEAVRDMAIQAIEKQKELQGLVAELREKHATKTAASTKKTNKK